MLLSAVPIRDPGYQRRLRTLSADRTGRTAFMAGWYLRQYIDRGEEREGWMGGGHAAALGMWCGGAGHPMTTAGTHLGEKCEKRGGGGVGPPMTTASHSPGCVHEGDPRPGQAVNDTLRAQVNGHAQCLMGAGGRVGEAVERAPRPMTSSDIKDPSPEWGGG